MADLFILYELHKFTPAKFRIPVSASARLVNTHDHSILGLMGSEFVCCQ